jgi:hypothetical protein
VALRDESDTIFALFSKSNPKVYKAYSYLNDWNSAVVFTLYKRLLADKGL